MLELAFSTEDVLRIRFAFSPLWEAVVSVRALRHPADRALHLPWIRRARRALFAARVDIGPLLDLVPTPTHYIPDFLTPPPTTPVPDFAAELAAVRAIAPEEVRAGLQRLGTAAGPFAARLADDPASGLAELTDTVTAYWEVALAPDWPRVRGLLEGEIAYRARRLAEGGAYLLFGDLHERVSFADDRLYVRHTHWHTSRSLDGSGLVLVPSVFAWPSVYTISQRPWQPTLLYPPRGIATVWETGTAAGPEALGAVLGRARARLLAELVAPASTTELARRTGLTPGAVSQQLTLLRSAGLVAAHRAGRVVLYARTETADALLAVSASR
ncbi:ArsR/SmtB family transcription factor [Actinocatenispora sera]|uniref:Transcriptional regulator n=1 Tax=Actinocatenispora sera TaxID=390989 RepID=A0A810L4A5_9ACTN|nr:winged helix-turn-helix domain-containing protein [Actinocatenispora sera]BCJ30057.1 transcriptional regulator [Actinocatenispora sera]